MSAVKDRIKNFVPAPIWRSAGKTWDALGRASMWPEANLHAWRRQSIEQIRLLKDSRKGQRCFIIGNGPSLRDTDLSQLRNEFTIGMNRIYLMFPDLGFKTSYYVCMNDLVIEQCAADIQKLDLPRFVSWRGRKWLNAEKGLFFLHTTYTGPKFGGSDITGRLWEGATVTYVALQTAFYLGFDEVILIGVDHNFTTQGKPNTTVVSQGDDPNHFSPAYFGKGFRWQLPDLETSEKGYSMAREAYSAAGRKIVDATVGGKLRVFPRVDYNTLFP